MLLVINPWINDKDFLEVNHVTAIKSNTKWQMGQFLILVTPGKNFTQYHTLWLLFYSKRDFVLYLSNILLHEIDAVHYLKWINTALDSIKPSYKIIFIRIY